MIQQVSSTPTAATHGFVRDILAGLRREGRETRLHEEHLFRLIRGLHLPECSNTWTREQFIAFCTALRRLTGDGAGGAGGGDDGADGPSIPTPRPSPPIPAGTRSGHTCSVTTLLVVDSNDRDRTAHPTANPFRIYFGYPPPLAPTSGAAAATSGAAAGAAAAFVPHHFRDVEEVTLLEAIVPRATTSPDVLLYPYVLLEVEELGRQFVATNHILSQCFAKLHLEPYGERYLRHIASCDTDAHINRKIFAPPVALTQLTFRLLTPGGELLGIPHRWAGTGTAGQEESNEQDAARGDDAPAPRVSLTFRIQSRRDAIEAVQIRL